MKKKMSSKIKKKTSEVKAHSEFGGSQAKRIYKCPASVKRCRGKESKENEASKRGTDAHACLEYFLLNRKKLKKRISRKKVMKYANNHKSWDQDMIDDALDTTVWVEDQIAPDGELFVEVKVESTKFTTASKKNRQKSTLDVGIANYNARELVIADYKYGKHPVKAKWNYQLIYYALGLLIKLKGWNKFDRIRLVIIQPNGPKIHAFNEWTMSLEQAIKWGKRFRKKVKISQGKNPPHQYGEWCFFCLGKPGCPEFSKRMMEKEFSN